MATRVVDIYSLTPIQQGMLYHSVVDGDPGLYCEQIRFELPPATSLRQWEDALRALVMAHPILRTGFEWEDLSRPVHVEQTDVEFRVARHDCTLVSDEERDRRLATFMDEDRRRGFDFRKPPLLRATAFEQRDSTTDVVLTFHHLLLDGWSISLLMRELEARYRAPSDTGVPRPRPFRDFIEWLLASNPLDSEQAWRSELEGFQGPLAFPPARRDSSAPADFAEMSTRLDPQQTATLKGAAGLSGLTLNTAVQGAWALALAAESGARDVVFGATVSGRPAGFEGIENMVGMFINTLPFRARVDPTATVGAWLRDLQARHARLRDCYEHTPLAMIHQWSGLNREHPLFETVLVFENFPPESSLVGRNGLGWSARIRSKQLTNYPVHVLVSPSDALDLHLTFDRARVSPEVIRRLLDRMVDILLTMARDIDGVVGQLPTVTAAEQATLARWSTAGSPPAYEDVNLRFLCQVAATPGAVAVAHNGRAIDYETLDRRASAIAAALLERGIGEEAVVGLCAERGIDYLAGVLGILRAGCVYMPLDPVDPPRRTEAAIRRSGTNLVLVTRSTANLSDHVPVLDLADVAPANAVSPMRRVPADLAYVIFTSGSTGEPKGAMVTHGGMWNHLASKIGLLSLGPDDVIAQNAPQGFDISIWQMLAPLLVGGCVQIYDDDVARDPSSLLARVRADGVTVLEVVPTILRLLPDEAPRRPAVAMRDRLRIVISTGETLPIDACRRWFVSWPQTPLLNAYGPTECSDDVTHHVMDHVPDGCRLVPIGKPIPGVRVYVLDADWRLLPPGVVGELYIGGTCVGRGYIGEPVLTAAAFVPDLFAEEPGARLYRTGDAARFLQDGTLEYRGRLDTQVKLHGNRIELGEIENVLGQLISSASVVTLRDADGGPRLVAYVEHRSMTHWSVDDLRRALGEWLPTYMVPSAVVTLERFPLTSSGKIDRLALPAPAPAASRKTAPRNETERTLVKIWRELLHVEHVGVDDNFFDLGGDSIRSIQFIARARREGVLLKQRDVFRHQTIAELARVATVSGAPRVAEPPPCGEVPLTPVQRWFFEQQTTAPSRWSLAVIAEAALRLDPAILERAVRAAAEHHDAMRLRFHQTAGGWIQSAEQPCALFLVRERGGADDDDTFVSGAVNALAGSLDIERGPVLAVALLRAPATPDRLALLVHHLCADALSIGWLLEDIGEVYAAISSARPVALPHIVTSFTAWAKAVNALAGADAIARERKVWSNAHALPSRAAIEAGPPQTKMLSLTPSESRVMLEELPQALAATAEDVLVTAVVRALAAAARWTTCVVEVERHGREELEPGLDVSRTVGLLTTTFPVAVASDPAEPPTVTLRSVKRALRVAKHGIAWGVLRFIARDPDCCALPSADVRFNYLGWLDDLSRSSGLFRLMPERLAEVQPRALVGQWPVDVSAFAVGGALQLQVTTCMEAAVAARFREALRGELETVARGDAFAREPVYVPADFPRAHLNEATLLSVLSQLGTGHKEE
jgi:amino acid adenylation domain-containing protein/non-ribosomal peptide synthase protein (TIGR01720 family)